MLLRNVLNFLTSYPGLNWGIVANSAMLLGYKITTSNVNVISFIYEMYSFLLIVNNKLQDTSGDAVSIEEAIKYYLTQKNRMTNDTGLLALMAKFFDVIKDEAFRQALLALLNEQTADGEYIEEDLQLKFIPHQPQS